MCKLSKRSTVETIISQLIIPLASLKFGEGRLQTANSTYLHSRTSKNLVTEYTKDNEGIGRPMSIEILKLETFKKFFDIIHRNASVFEKEAQMKRSVSSIKKN